MIDLHCHSHFSDGMLSPQALLDKAIHAGIQMLALTDHDTLEGSDMLQNLMFEHNITLIHGIELSTRWKKHDIHVLGLRMVVGDTGMRELITQQNHNRIQRSLEISERMASLGVHHAYDKACHIAGHERVGRPHFAQVLVNEGKVIDIQSAFKRYLGRGKPGFVATPWVPVREAVEGIIRAGGQAVLAHPLKYGLTRTKLHELVTYFKLAGGVALEVVSGEMTVSQVQEMVGLCLRFQLLSSTGSDFHGDALSRISLGRQRQLPLNCTPVWHQWNI